MELNAETTRLFDFYAFQQKHFPAEDSLAGKVNGKWEKYSTAKVIDLSNQLSTGLLKLGIAPGDKIALISNNRPEWIITDLAIVQIGAVNVPMYPTNAEKDYELIIDDADVKVVFVSDTEILEKVRKGQKGCPDLKSVF